MDKASRVTWQSACHSGCTGREKVVLMWSKCSSEAIAVNDGRITCAQHRIDECCDRRRVVSGSICKE